MKKNTHPKYQTILFVDTSTGRKWLCGSTIEPDQTEKFEGKEYPVCYLSTSAYSHPFFTGSNQLADTEGRVQKFKNRYAAAQKKTEETQEKKVAAAAPATKAKRTAKK